MIRHRTNRKPGTKWVFAIAATFFFVSALACTSTVPAAVTERSFLPIDAGAEVFVFASAQREAIVASLEQAGVPIASRFEEMSYALEVKIGSGRGSRSCGGVNNVSFALMRSGQQLLLIKGRGATGNCNPNIFDDMSRVLAENML